MFFVTYRNLIRSDKDITDFKDWLNSAWPVQKQWGAREVKYWQNSADGFISCQYEVDDLSLWISNARSVEGNKIILALDKVVETDKTSLKITRATGIRT